MKILPAIGPHEAKQLDSQALRENFLLLGLAQPGQLNLVYTHYDRAVVGVAQPLAQPLELPTYPHLRADYFLERRELGIINVGGPGQVQADGQTYALDKLDCLYLGKGTRQVRFASQAADRPATFFLLSAPAHQAYPAALCTKQQAAPVNLGDPATANQRTIYKYIHLAGLPSCQLVMGLTVLAPGSVWNTMPAHVHDRRMEAYFYFDLPAEHRVFHLMGEPQQTRHLVVANHEAVLSPPWSIHAGCGTTHYGFIWGMAGENLDFTDMDRLAIGELV
jgi:4-deoxy-L-threo-5-hexosulose-uronate ketol-isomerase